MLDLFLKLVDRIIDLIRVGQSDRRTPFRDVVEPLFLELQPVVDDYFALFREAGVAVRASSPSHLSDAVGEIRRRREAMLRVRVQIRAMAKELEARSGEKRVADFGLKLLAFFSSTELNRGRSPSHGAVLVELCDYVAEERLEKGLLDRYIQQTLHNLETSWVTVAGSYARLRLYCLAPSRYVPDSSDASQHDAEHLSALPTSRA